MDLQQAAFRFEGTLRTTTGREFRGAVIDPRQLRTFGDDAAFALQVRKTSLATAGCAVLFDFATYLLADGTTEWLAGPLFHTLRMILVTHKLAWTRATTSTDAVSGLPALAGAPANLGSIFVALVPLSKIGDAFHVETSKYRAIVAEDVQIDDRLGDYIVTFVQSLYGLNYAEVR